MITLFNFVILCDIIIYTYRYYRYFWIRRGIRWRRWTLYTTGCGRMPLFVYMHRAGHLWCDALRRWYFSKGSSYARMGILSMRYYQSNVNLYTPPVFSNFSYLVSGIKVQPAAHASAFGFFALCRCQYRLLLLDKWNHCGYRIEKIYYFEIYQQMLHSHIWNIKILDYVHKRPWISVF